MDPELQAALDALRDHIDQRVDRVEARLESVTAETRRHFDVVAESLRADIQLVAEGVTALSERVDRLEVNLREEILRAQRELSAMIQDHSVVAP